MNPELWQKAHELFLEFRKRAPEERGPFLKKVCGADQELSDAVEHMLEEDRTIDTVSNAPTVTRRSQPSRLEALITTENRKSRLVAGRPLGPYNIIGGLAAGGMAEVYRAHDPRLRRDVAIKVLPERLTDDPQALARFSLEARAIAALSHPNILAVFDMGVDQGISYVVTELLEGESLADRLRRGPIPWQQAVEYGIAVAQGLNAAHSKGLIHRDLKPDNIFLASENILKLLDFGIVRWKSGVLSDSGQPLSDLTSAGTVLGTIGYMSPEQVRGETAEAPSDIFSFGCVLYEMLTGRRAFRRNSAAETLAAILKEHPAPPSRVESGIPPGLDRN